MNSDTTDDGSSGAVPASKVISEELRCDIGDHRFLVVRVDIASVPILNPPPRPKKDEVVVHYRLDEERIVTMTSAVMRGETAAPIVGGGPRPGDN